MDSVYSEAIDKDAKMSLVSENVKGNKRQMENLARAYESTMDSELRKQFDEEAEGLKTRLKEMQELAETDEGRKRVARLEEVYAVYVESAYNYMDARDSKEEAYKALESGAVDFLKKPFAIEDLLSNVDEVLGGGRES